MATTSLLNPDDGPAWRAVNSAPFIFRHSLAGHPLLETPRLIRLSERVADRGLNGNYFFTDSDKVRSIPELKSRLAQTIEQLESGDCWFKLGDVHEADPDYRHLMEELIAEIQVFTGSKIPRTPDTGVTIFMNSPGLVVPYHFDHETNFLMQIRGEKEVSLFPNDEFVVTRAEREDYYRGNPMAGRWRDELEDKAARYRITPGLGVHHPPLSPHRIRNGATSALSMTVSYSLPAYDARGRIYRANYHLRKWGLKPRPPGGSAAVDQLKNYGILGAVSVLKPLRRWARAVKGAQRQSIEK